MGIGFFLLGSAVNATGVISEGSFVVQNTLFE